MITQLVIRWLIANWLKVLVSVVVVGVAGAIYTSGYNAAWDKALKQTREVELASMRRDLDAERIQRADAEVALKELAQQDADNEQQLQKLRAELAARDPAVGRGLTQSELDLLLGRSKAGKR